MPPKKKKTAISPIVVGTVSTRSTRRQSIVNIDIPKSGKTSVKTSLRSSQETSELSAAESLSEKIKQTYNKMFSGILEPFSKMSKGKLTDSIKASEMEEKPSVRSNEALLQILEDWNDDDSQDDKKASTETIEQFSNIQEGTEGDEGTRYLETEIYTNQIDVPLEMQEYTNKVVDEEGQSYIIEENVSVPIEEHVEEIVAFEENIVECVTEEVVTDEIDQFDLMDTSQNNTTAAISDQQDLNVSPDLKKSSTIIDEIKEETDDLVAEENSQSFSVTDSNDAEVTSFVMKEIENNKTVKEEDIPMLDGKSKEQIELAKEAASSEETGNSYVTVMENTVQSGCNLNDTEENAECELDQICKKSEELLLEDEVTEEVSLNTGVPEPMDTTEDDTIESKVAQMHLMDEVIKDEDTSDEMLEVFNKSTVDLNYPLKEDIEEVIGVKASRRYLKERLKFENDDEPCEKKEIKLEEDLEQLLEKPKTRRTRASDTKTKKEELTDSVPAKTSRSKEKKVVKTKDTKSKESKPVKEQKKKKPTPPPPKKGKDKSDKKDVAKSDRKDSKKVSKNDDQSIKSTKTENTDSEDTEVRRSSRIKSISVLKKKTTGYGLVRSKSEPVLNESDVSDSNSVHTESERSTPSASPKVLTREKKTRWSRSTENVAYDTSVTESVSAKGDSQLMVVTPMEVDEKPKLPIKDPVVTARLKQFIHLKENSYKTDRMTCKEAKKMTCDCFLTSDEVEANEFGCGEDCLNRLLLIECGTLCQVGDRCTNKRFQKGQFAPVEVFNTEKKGLGLRAAANIPYGEFILEYVGEVLNCEEFDKRAEVYSQDKNIHYYFMSLRADAIIDATVKGNISRFINHSCDPNAETQKWTVNGELRIGFFSTRTILAGEEITFDYRFQRYGKEAQRCYCEASVCRGWLGEQPDEDSEEEDEEDEEEEEEEEAEAIVAVKAELPLPDAIEKKEEAEEPKAAEVEEGVTAEVKIEKAETETVAVKVTPKRKSPRKKPRKDLFEELDQLDEEIEMLLTTGLKNQAHTLKLSRLMVRAKEPPQRTKLLRILRRGELPCRRLFLDYHGLRLMHGYMIDAQHLVHNDKKFESLRLEMLQTLAVLPIPNKTMLQDSKVLPTVEKWATDKDLGSPQDSDSNSPKTEPEAVDEAKKEKPADSSNKTAQPKKEDETPERSIEDQEEEIRFLATKLLEGWANLKEVFRIPKKERIEQMKEHEREANKKFMQGGYGNEPDSGRKSDRYRNLSRYKAERDTNRKGSKLEEKPSAEFIRLSKIERRKLFALQHELKEEERRLKQREMWRQHELNCLMIGTDPRFTAPFDPSRGYQCIWNPQIGQWQNYPLSAQNQLMFSSQGPVPQMGPLPNMSLPPPQLQPAKTVSFPYSQPMPLATSINSAVAQLPTSMGIAGQVPPHQHIQAPQQAAIAQMQMNSMQGIPGALPQNIPTHSQIPASLPAQPPLPQYADVKKEEDPSQVKFLGPIPPPAKLPPKWKCAKDKYGRPYYYHVKLRKSQWEPPPYVEPVDEPEFSASESETSSDTSSVSSDTSSENSDSEDDIDDTRLLIEVRKQMEKSAKLTLKSVIPEHVKVEDTPTPSPDDRNSEEEAENEEDVSAAFADEEERPSIDIRLKEQFNLLKDDNPPKKRRRVGLCEEIMISPRSEEDRLQFKEDLKRYKANKEKLKRQKEIILQQTRKQLRETEAKKAREKRTRATLKSRIKEMPDFNSEQAKKIKESFRANMASTVVGSLNAYRKPDCKEGRITNTEDFKHLARKLTHFVMLKEMKHIEKIEDLTCTDNVKSKAREYIRKYMSKFGEVYVKRNDSPDFKD